MLNKLPFSDQRIIVELDHGQNPVVYEPLVRKLGGVWNKNLHAWMFSRDQEAQVDDFVRSQNKLLADSQNKEYFTKFSEEPQSYNTPSSSSSASSAGINEAFDLIQELFERVSDLEKIVEEHGRKIQQRR